MKRLNLFGMAILGMLFLSMMFNACQKDEELMQVQPDELEVRAKPCTSTKYATVKAEVPDNATAQDVWNALEPQILRVIIKTKHDVLRDVLKEIRMDDIIPDYWHLTTCGDISDHLCSDDVYGWGTSIISYGISKGQLVFVVVNLELNEQSAAPNYVQHEDFHTYVGMEIVKKCAEEAVNRTGLPCLEAGDEALQTLRDLNAEAQALYDSMCEDCNFEHNRADAREAVNVVVENFLTS